MTIGRCRKRGVPIVSATVMRVPAIYRVFCSIILRRAVGERAATWKARRKRCVFGGALDYALRVAKPPVFVLRVALATDAAGGR